MLNRARIEALCTDGMYAGVNGDQSEWNELCALAIAGLSVARPEAAAISREVAIAALPSLHDVMAGIEPEDLGWISRLAAELERIGSDSPAASQALHEEKK